MSRIIDLGNIPEDLLPPSEEVRVVQDLPHVVWRSADSFHVLPEGMEPPEGYSLSNDEELNAWANRAPLPWTDGTEVRYGFEFNLPGWRRVDDEAELQSLLSAQAMALATTEAADLRREASEIIAVLQDAVDDDVATETEAALLLAWKAYRIALRRVPEQPGYPTDIEWPVQPA